jgi:hypothetical protein
MSDESKDKRRHEQHHPHHPHKHEHSKPGEASSIHPGWLLVFGAILIIVIVLGWTMNYGF